jgi:hypothetical protein
MKTDKMYISNIGKGVESSLVAVKDPEFDYVEVSLQRNKNVTKHPKIVLISKRIDFDKFLKKLRNEVTNHTTPELYPVATLHCTSQCEILKVLKVDKDSFDVLMYYNYRRPRTKKCVDYVSLTLVDLEKFVNGI